VAAAAAAVGVGLEVKGAVVEGWVGSEKKRTWWRV
jgi:hypothetical protein